MWFKNKNAIIKTKNTKCARPTWFFIIIMLTHANMNMKRTWKGYGVRLSWGSVLNKLKEMKGSTPIYIPLKV
jgi:hypothetical protein